jgi:transposase
MYEALRAYFLEGRPSRDVAREFGYTPGSFRVLCHQFRRNPDPQFFLIPQPGPKRQPLKTAAHDRIVALRKQNHSVYEISEALRQEGLRLSPTAVREVLKQEGCRVSRSSVAVFSRFFVADRRGKRAVPDSAGGGGIRDCF